MKPANLTKIRDVLGEIIVIILVTTIPIGINIDKNMILTFFRFLIAGVILVCIERFSERYVKNIAKHLPTEIQIIAYLAILFGYAYYLSSIVA